MINCPICNTYLDKCPYTVSIYKCSYCKINNEIKIMYSTRTNSALVYKIMYMYTLNNTFGVGLNFKTNTTKIFLDNKLIKSYDYLFTKEKILKSFTQKSLEKYYKLYNVS